MLLGAGSLLAAVLAYGGAGRAAAASDPRLPIGVLGDSDSQAYQENWRARGIPAHGGVFYASTFQWPEVFTRLRGMEVDFGPWGRWGVPRRISLSWLRDALGLRWRAPRKVDYRYNFAWPTGCSSLFRGRGRQVPRLLEVMAEDPERWRRGIVIIRIGINDFGKESLDSLALDGDDSAVRQRMKNCVAEIGRSVKVIRARHADTAIVLVGIYDNTHWPELFDKFRSASAPEQISRGLDFFDTSLRDLCRTHTRVIFFDDRQFFRVRWGSRNAQGLPAYSTVKVGALEVGNTAGDSPENLVLKSGHSGVVWNLLWVQALIEQLRVELGMPISRVSAAEIETFIGVRAIA